MKIVEYKAPDGRYYRRGIPDGAPPEEASVGVPLGPPDLDGLDLPHDVNIRLHNELYNRGIYTADDARRRRADVQVAIRAALKLSTSRILAIYEES